MKLLVANEGNTVEALPDFENYIDPATGGVAFERVGEVLRAIRLAASALRPPATRSALTAARLEGISSTIYATADHINALVTKAGPDDADALAVLPVLRRLGLTPPA
jgi:hypothetical protein